MLKYFGESNEKNNCNFINVICCIAFSSYCRFCIVLGTLEPKKVFEITYYTEDHKRLNILVTARSAAGAVKQFYKLKGRTNSIHYIEEEQCD